MIILIGTEAIDFKNYIKITQLTNALRQFQGRGYHVSPGLMDLCGLIGSRTIVGQLIIVCDRVGDKIIELCNTNS